MFKKIASSVHVLMIILLTSTIQADDVLIKNQYKQPVQFRVRVPSTGFDKTITLRPGETQNAIGTDLWHNALVTITGISFVSGKKDCVLLIKERKISGSLLETSFYLPDVTHTSQNPPCPYNSNLPPHCDCFIGQMGCTPICREITNAQVIVKH